MNANTNFSDEENLTPPPLINQEAEDNCNT